MQEVPCNLCSADDYVVIAERGRFNMPLRTVICRRCGLVYTNPVPSHADLEDFYAHRYWGMYRRADVPDERFFKKRIRRVRPFFDEVRPWLSPGMKVLDVGCGVGALLLLIAQEGPQCVGVEPHEAHSAFAREHVPAPVLTGTFEQAAPQLAGERFDVIIFRHVLEHTSSPTQVLCLARELLAENGIVFLETPNVMFPGQSLARFFHIGHPFNFSPVTLPLLLRKCGLLPEVVRELDGWTPRERLQVVGRRAEPEENIDFASEGQDYRQVIARLRRHQWGYLLTLGSLRKKLRLRW